MNSLQQLVETRLRELNLSYRKAADLSGGKVSHGTLYNVVNGTHGGRFSEETLRGIAKAIKVPVAEVRKAAGQDPDEPTEFRMPKKADKLTRAERRVILAMVDQLLDQHERGRR